MIKLQCKNENLTEEIVDAIAIFEWYLDVTEKKYFGKDWHRSLSRYDLYYQYGDEGIILHVVTSFSETHEEETDAHRAYVHHMADRVNTFMQLAVSYTDVEQLLELCEYREKKWETSRYGGGRGIPAEQLDWSIFRPDYGKLVVEMEDGKRSYDEIEKMDWHRPTWIEIKYDVTSYVRELLGDIVLKAEGTVDYHDNYMDAKIYLNNLSSEKHLQVGGAEYLEDLQVKFVNGKAIEFSSSDFGWVNFKEE